MRSGITPSSALSDAFKAFSSDPTSFALLITIDKLSETLEPLTTVPTSSNDFHASLSLLAPHLLPDRPLYLLLRRYTSDPPFVMVTYSPDTAHVSWKTLFASSKGAMMEAFGPGRLRQGMFATEAKELGRGEYERWERSEGMGGPLTEEEEAAKRVKEGEEEVKSGGTREKKLVGAQGLKLAIEGDAMERMKGLKNAGGDNLVMLSIDRHTEIIELAGTATTDAEGLASHISDTEPRYSLWRCSDADDTGSSPPIMFIYTCPSGPDPKVRVLYATSKNTFIERAEGEAELNIVKRLEASSPSEITVETIEDELRPKQVQKQGFARPKRPGKR